MPKTLSLDTDTGGKRETQFLFLRSSESFGGTDTYIASECENSKNKCLGRIRGKDEILQVPIRWQTRLHFIENALSLFPLINPPLGTLWVITGTFSFSLYLLSSSVLLGQLTLLVSKRLSSLLFYQPEFNCSPQSPLKLD